MAADVTIQFRVAGIGEIQNAFRTVEQSVQRVEQQSTRHTRDSAKQRVQVVQDEVKTRVGLYRENARADERVGLEVVKALEQQERQKTRNAEQWAKQRERIVERSAQMAFRMAEAEVRAVERAEREKHAHRERYGRMLGSSINGSFGRLANGAVNMASAALMLGGGFSIADAVHQQFSAQRTAAQIVNAVTTTGSAPAGANVNSIMNQASGVAIKSGMTKDEVLRGTLAYTRSAQGGNFEGAMGNMDFFAKLSKTTGTSIEDIGAAAGTLQSQNAELGKDPAKMRQMMLNAYAQTKSGSVSLKDAAKQFGVLGSTRGFYAGDEGRNQQVLFGLGQLAAPAGDPSEIGTYAKNLGIQAMKGKNRDKLAAMGVKFDHGQIASPEQMVTQVFKGTGGDLGKIGDIFGTRGLPLFENLAKDYRAAGGGDKGMKAVESKIATVTQSTMTGDDLEKQFQTVMQTPAEKFVAALEKIKETISEKLEPKLEEFADKIGDPENMRKIEDFIDGVAKAADWFMSNPLEGLGLIVAGTVAKDIAGAMIGNAVKEALSKAIGAGAGGALSLVGVGAVAITAEKAWIDESTKEDKDRRGREGGAQGDIANALGKLRANPTKENVAEAQKVLQSAQAAQAGIGTKTGFGQVASWFQSDDDTKAEEKRNKKLFFDLATDITQLSTAIKNATATTNATVPANRKAPMSAPERGGTGG